jgi:histidine triad (HIT) family protein
MPSVFTLILNGDLPAHFVYRDEVCAAFMSIEPVKPGHTLVVPTAEVDHWLDLEADTLAHITSVSQKIARDIDRAYSPTKVAMMVLGLEVPHAHIHLIPIDSEADARFSNATSASQDELASSASLIRAQLDE